MFPAQLFNRLIEIEVDSQNEPDCRRVIRNERMTLQAAMQSGDASRIAAAAAVARHVAKLWGFDMENP